MIHMRGNRSHRDRFAVCCRIRKRPTFDENFTYNNLFSLHYSPKRRARHIRRRIGTGWSEEIHSLYNYWWKVLSQHFRAKDFFVGIFGLQMHIPAEPADRFRRSQRHCVSYAILRRWVHRAQRETSDFKMSKKLKKSDNIFRNHLRSTKSGPLEWWNRH